MKWPQSIIKTKQGEKTAIEPNIISASRATDIPAFHAQWFMARLKAGYSLWKNPFNPAQSQYVSFKKCRLIVFWSKNPAPLLPYLAQIEDMGLQFYFHFTINDYANEKLEPGLAPLSLRLATFQELAERFGSERVIWRFDPIIIGGNLDLDVILSRIEELAKQIKPYSKKFVFSFVDLYRKTKRNLARINSAFRPPTQIEAETIARELVKRLKPLEVVSCAENLAHIGIKPSACIDPALVKKFCPELAVEFPRSNLQKSVQLSLMPMHNNLPREKLCGCIPAKDIGAYESCRHACVYCYACSSQSAVRAKLAQSDPESESL